MKILCVVIVLALAVGLAVAVLLHGPSPSERSLEPPAKAPVPETERAGSETLGVDELMKSAERFSGGVTVEGVVSATSAEKNSLALIDCAEFEACRTTTCAKLVLPVRWTGVMPPVEARVLVKGRVEKTSSGLVFAALELQTASVTGGPAK